MKIVLANGVELTPYTVNGSNQFVQGAQRDVLSFVFPAEAGLANLDEAFTAEACEVITIVADDGTEYIHKGYTIRGELKKAAVVITLPTLEAPSVEEDRITLTVGQRTYTESQLAAVKESTVALEDALAMTDETAIELYEAMMAQEEINTAQDDALIELYEMIGG